MTEPLPDVDEAIAAVAAAIAGGDALGSLDRLAAVSDALTDPRLDGAMVELRHAAFAELDRTPGRPAWPVPLADPFPDATDLPTAAPGDLSGEVLGGALVHHGCLRVDGLVSADQVARIEAHIRRSFEAREAVREGTDASAAAPWFVPFEPGQEKAGGFGAEGFVRTVDAPVALRELAAVFAETGVTRAVTDYLGERPAMIANKWVLRRTPSGKAGTDYHQDGAFLGEGIRTVDCWLALSHCGPGTGRPAIDLVPRRFDLLAAGEGAAFPWSLAEEVVHAAAPDAAVASPVFRPGDVLFFDERLPHRTSVGLDLGERLAVESWFVAPSSYPAKHVPVVL